MRVWIQSIYGIKLIMSPRELAKECDRILESKKFRDYPGAKNGLQVSHNKPVKKVGWAVDADIESIRKAGKERVDFLIVHHGIFWGNSTMDRKIRAERILLAKRLGVAIYSSHLPLDAHPEMGNSFGILRALGLDKWKRKRFGKAMGREIGYKVEGGRGEVQGFGESDESSNGEKGGGVGSWAESLSEDRDCDGGIWGSGSGGEGRFGHTDHGRGGLPDGGEGKGVGNQFDLRRAS